MKEKILLLACISCLSISAFATDGCVTVKQNGTYVVGDSKKDMPKSSIIMDKGISGNSSIKSMPGIQIMILR